jgi:hypothetical protein
MTEITISKPKVTSLSAASSCDYADATNLIMDNFNSIYFNLESELIA